MPTRPDTSDTGKSVSPWSLFVAAPLAITTVVGLLIAATASAHWLVRLVEFTWSVT